MTGENHVNHNLCRHVERVIDAGVIKEMCDDSELERRHITELEERMKALDDKEVYVVVKTLVDYRREAFVRTLEHLEKERGTQDE